MQPGKGMGTHFSHFLLAGPDSPVYIPATSCTDSSVVERLSYTQLVGGSNPSPCTINKPRKLDGLRGLLLWPALIGFCVIDDWVQMVFGASGL